MITSLNSLNLFLKKHKRKKSAILWAMAHRKEEFIKDINKRIVTQNYHFGTRITRIVEKKKATYYSHWEDRFVDYCLYSYLTNLAVQKNLISPQYVSFRGRGRHHAIKNLLIKKQSFKYVFKTDIKSYFESMDLMLLEKTIYKTGLPPFLYYLIWQNLFIKHDKISSQFPRKGIFQGNSMSSYYAWIYLNDLDKTFDKMSSYYYQRYKDDFLVLSHNINSLNKSQDIIYYILREKNLKTRYNKTFKGTVSKPISYLGFVIRENQIKQSIESKNKGKRFNPIVWEK